MSAAERYAARVDALLAQRTRLRGEQPPGDLFAGLPVHHSILRSDARRTPEPNLTVIASYVEPDDVVLDVGGGGGRYSLPLALQCREVVNVDPSGAMLAGFAANAERAGIANARGVLGSWPVADAPHGSLALVVHVAYLTRDIVAFIEALERAASRRIVMVVGSPPPISRNPELFRMVFDEESVIAPGHAELVNVLWELGIEPDVRLLPGPSSPTPIQPTREAAERVAASQLPSHQWAMWPLDPVVDRRVQEVVAAHFDDLFAESAGGYRHRWTEPKHDVLVTWTPRR